MQPSPATYSTMFGNDFLIQLDSLVKPVSVLLKRVLSFTLFKRLSPEISEFVNEFARWIYTVPQPFIKRLSSCPSLQLFRALHSSRQRSVEGSTPRPSGSRLVGGSSCLANVDPYAIERAARLHRNAAGNLYNIFKYGISFDQEAL